MPAPSLSQETYAYVACGHDNGDEVRALWSIDVSTPSAPVEVGFIDHW